MEPSVILLEFNELCPLLMQRFMREGKLPNFQKFYDESQVCVTDAEEESPYLEPWIQWVTVHSGMSYRDHQVFHLSDGPTLDQKCIWDVLSEHGHRVWVCGSMNIRYEQPVNGLILPDPWATETVPSDPRLEPYFRFVKHNVLEHTNEHSSLSIAEYASFASFMAMHGLSMETVQAIVSQLAVERLGHSRWKRATLLDKLQFDVFSHFYGKLRPSFSSFFLNSTAHFQHLYWRNMEPDLFLNKPTADEQAEYASAVLFGYQEMDRLLARFDNLADPDTTLIFCTGLSQQPCLRYEADGGKSFYRPKDFERFLKFTGIKDVTEIVPVMSENFNIRFKSEQAAAVAKDCLSRLRVGQTEALSIEQRGNSLYSGCSVFTHISPDETLSMLGGGPSVLFFELFYKVEGLKSGMHHPEGMLWIRRPDRKHRTVDQKVPLTTIAPMILDMFSLPKPAFMQPRAPAAASALVA